MHITAAAVAVVFVCATLAIWAAGQKDGSCDTEWQRLRAVMTDGEVYMYCELI